MVPPYFIFLKLTSQSNNKNIRYYNINTPLDNIYECATDQLCTVINLFENLYEFNEDNYWHCNLVVTFIYKEVLTTLISSIKRVKFIYIYYLIRRYKKAWFLNRDTIKLFGIIV